MTQQTQSPSGKPTYGKILADEKKRLEIAHGEWALGDIIPDAQIGPTYYDVFPPKNPEAEVQVQWIAFTLGNLDPMETAEKIGEFWDNNTKGKFYDDPSEVRVHPENPLPGSKEANYVYRYKNILETLTGFPGGMEFGHPKAIVQIYKRADYAPEVFINPENGMAVFVREFPWDSK